MGYAGQPMKVIKANRALLKKSRSFTELRKSYVKFSGDTFVATKNISDFERKKIVIKHCTVLEGSTPRNRAPLYILRLSLVLIYILVDNGMNITIICYGFKIKSSLRNLGLFQ